MFERQRNRRHPSGHHTHRVRNAPIVIALISTALVASLAFAAQPQFPDDETIARELRQGTRPLVLPFNAGKSNGHALQRLLEQAEQRNATPSPQRLAPADVLVFVSLSMPAASLKRLAEDTARIGAVMVFRGFKDSSLAKTREALQPLITNETTVHINPPAFSAYDIESVPTFVVTQAPAPGTYAKPLFTSVAGDVTLAYALDRLAQSDAPLGAIAKRHALRLRQEGGA